ncbi:hypothetical protein P154DRAFT_578427 [Amniculicola lignicola CBS 123094]|uniref:Uncharacterized protein n=1 Tax=Amniculicola lignicola CBS 123094 TaxID=1392246 RepID=A0A6A5W932_9PLEO|nr:hypothetical protein P154DRAFT_578427 [Amniculicola lignicola CBS 123094]
MDGYQDDQQFCNKDGDEQAVDQRCTRDQLRVDRRTRRRDGGQVLAAGPSAEPIALTVGVRLLCDCTPADCELRMLVETAEQQQGDREISGARASKYRRAANGLRAVGRTQRSGSAKTAAEQATTETGPASMSFTPEPARCQRTVIAQHKRHRRTAAQAVLLSPLVLSTVHHARNGRLARWAAVRESVTLPGPPPGCPARRQRLRFWFCGGHLRRPFLGPYVLAMRPPPRQRPAQAS